MQKQIYSHVMKFGLILIISICSIMLGMTYRQTTMLEKQLYNHASALFELIVITRQWNSGYGGVFVEKKPGITANSFLENPDITDIKGKKYTKKNPAIMTREISAIAESSADFTFHITSFKLKNPANTPDEWEKTALTEFENGAAEKVGIIKKGNSNMYRFMKPLIISESCLTCHREQGYRLGDVRGGKIMWQNCDLEKTVSGISPV